MSEAEDMERKTISIAELYVLLNGLEKIDELLPGDVVNVTISENPDGSRTVEVK